MVAIHNFKWVKIKFKNIAVIGLIVIHLKFCVYGNKFKAIEFGA